MSGSRGVPGTSTSPGSDGGGRQQAPAPVLDATIKSRLIANGERDRLKRLLAERLEQSGWRDQLTAAAAAHLASTEEEEQEKRGGERKTSEEGRGGGDAAAAAAVPRPPSTTTTSAQLAAVLTPAAQAAVPDSIKAELLAAVRASVLSA